MLDGWYCRTLANEQAAQQDETDPNISGSDDFNGQNASQGAVDYKAQYRYLKRKLKFLIFENEFFQDALRSNQRRLLKISRDRAFLLDRLLQYEKTENTSSESEETESSDDEITKRRKLEVSPVVATNGGGGLQRGRKRKMPTHAPQSVRRIVSVAPPAAKKPITESQIGLTQQQGHMTAAEVERHLQSKQPVMQLMPERATATVPAEMFSNDPSLDSESNNDHLFDGSSPTHVAAEECVPMEYIN